MSESQHDTILDLDVVLPVIQGHLDEDDLNSLDYSIYPVRFVCLFQDLALKWYKISNDCVLLISDHILNHQELLVSLATNNLQMTEYTTRYVVDLVIAFYREHPERTFVSDGIPSNIDPQRNYSAGTSPEVIFLRNTIMPELRDVGRNYLTKTRIAVKQFLNSDASSSFLLSFGSGRPNATVDPRLVWSDTIGYAVWHDWFPDQTLVWFSNPVIRDFLYETLANASSDIWVGFQESKSPLDPPDVTRPVVTYEIEKASYVLAWFIVELRALTSQANPFGAQALTAEHVMIVAEECAKILGFLHGINKMRDNPYAHSACKQWLKFMPLA